MRLTPRHERPSSACRSRRRLHSVRDKSVDCVEFAGPPERYSQACTGKKSKWMREGIERHSTMMVHAQKKTMGPPSRRGLCYLWLASGTSAEVFKHDHAAGGRSSSKICDARRAFASADRDTAEGALAETCRHGTLGARPAAARDSLCSAKTIAAVGLNRLAGKTEDTASLEKSWCWPYRAAGGSGADASNYGPK